MNLLIFFRTGFLQCYASKKVSSTGVSQVASGAHQAVPSAAEETPR